MKLDPDCKYNEEHEWIRVEGDEGVIGITDYAQEQLSDIVYVELPEVGDTFERGDVFAVVESVKAASDVYMPVGGEILEINEDLEDSPELVNQDPYGEAWFVRICHRRSGRAGRLDGRRGYQAFVEGLDECQLPACQTGRPEPRVRSASALLGQRLDSLLQRRTHMSYVPHTDADRAEMLAAIGVEQVEDLFHDVPAAFRFPELNLPEPLSEMEIMAELQAMSEENLDTGHFTSFLGGRRLQSLCPPRRGPHHQPLRVLHRLYALPARDQPGHPAEHLRVPEHDLRPDRHGGGQRLPL